MTEIISPTKAREEQLPLDVEWGRFSGEFLGYRFAKIALTGSFLSLALGVSVGVLIMDSNPLANMVSTAIVLAGFVLTYLFAAKDGNRQEAGLREYRSKFAEVTATRLREKGWNISVAAAAGLLQKWDVSVTDEADGQEYIASTDLTTFKGDFTVTFILATDVIVKQRAAAEEWKNNSDSVGAFNAGAEWATRNRS